MSQIMMKEGTYLHSLLLQELDHNIDDIVDIKKCSEAIVQATNEYNLKINSNMKSLLIGVKKRQQNSADQNILMISKYLLETLNQLSKKMNSIAKKMNIQVIIPLEDYVSFQSSVNNSLLKKSEEMLTLMEANTSFLSELSKNFALDNISDFTKQQKEDLRNVYEQQMGKCNERWKDIKKSYKDLLIELDKTYSKRTNFVCKSQIILIRTVNKLLNSTIIEQRINYAQESLQQNLMISSLRIKEKIRQNLGKSCLFEEQSTEDMPLKSQGKYEDKQIVNDFIQVFTSRYNIKQQQKNHQKARTLILQVPFWSSYFLKKFQSHLHTQIRLPNVKYHQLTTIMKYLFASIVELQNNQQQIYNILYITYRVSNNENYIIEQIGKYDDFWTNNQRWQNLIQYIQSTRRQKSLAYKYAKKLEIITTIWNWNPLYRKKQKNTEKQIKSQKVIHDAKDFQVISQINYYMARLKLKNQFIFNFIALIGQKYSISKQNLEKLFKFHYFNQKNTINNLDMIEVRRKRIEEKYRNLERITDKSVICVGKSLKYLKAQPWLLTLRLVCKKWGRKLQKKIYKRFLIQQKDVNIVNKVRLKLYISISQVGYQKEVYYRMVKQVPQFTQHTQIILLDSRRSLTWDEDLRGTLIEILRTFSFYHSSVGYLQGMNYLCENILKITNDGYNVYRIFQHLMNHHYFGMYSANFESLKIKIYQFMRIVSRQLPKLSNHFEAEKIQGQHFLLSWAITLWGEMSGDLCWILWDGFLVKGWKWWIKTGIWLLRILEPQLLQLTFQGIMKCFSELSSTLFAFNLRQLQNFGINTSKIKQQIDRIILQDQTLKDLQKEYNLKVSMLRQYLKKIKDN